MRFNRVVRRLGHAQIARWVAIAMLLHGCAVDSVTYVPDGGASVDASIDVSSDASIESSSTDAHVSTDTGDANVPVGSILMGTSDNQPTSFVIAPGAAALFRIRASVSASATGFNVYVGSTSLPAATPIAVSIYSDSSGTPGALLVQGTRGAVTVGEWNLIPLASPAPVVAGTFYWLGVLVPSGSSTLEIYTFGPPDGSATMGQTVGSSFPSTWSGGAASGDGPPSAYVTN